MDRRKFLESVCAAGAGIAIAGNLIDITKVSKAIARSRKSAADVREIPINLIDVPELKPVGGTYHLEVEDTSQNILVVHASPDKFIAVDIKCTHRGCDINYDGDGKKFICPCHGSEYDLYGRNTKGPAQKPLNYYHAELKGDEVNVTVYGPNDPVPANSIRPAPDTTRIDSNFVRKPNAGLDSSAVDSIIHK
jgi:Rieske Fe-S protein